MHLIINLSVAISVNTGFILSAMRLRTLVAKTVVKFHVWHHVLLV